ncbi:MAG: hypothetical protein EHM35_02690 [Planctomycetaceae bacterium]|nr:MAG: hypothetical protein EHM35_02690 [Planctomycetaceae bacterium]
MTDEQIERIRAAAEKLQAAKREFEQVVAEISREPSATATPVVRRARRSARAAKPDSGKARYCPDIHVKCAVCGKVQSGGKAIGDNVIPYRHANAADTAICPGSDQPGTKIEKGDPS